MNKLKNLIGSACFLFSAWTMRWSMNWITTEKSRLAVIEQTIKLGKIAEAKKAKWHTLTHN